jgi:hypothetical protein
MMILQLRSLLTLGQSVAVSCSIQSHCYDISAELQYAYFISVHD